MAGNGILVTNIGDHHKDFMHVSPKLGALRPAVHASGYREILANFIYQKPQFSAAQIAMSKPSVEKSLSR